MEGPRLYILTTAQGVAVGLMFWVLATWRTPWDALRYVGTALAIIGVAVSPSPAISWANRFRSSRKLTPW